VTETAWFWWAAVAVLLVIGEVFTGTFFVICFAAGALGAALAAGLGASFAWQIAAFIVISLAAVGGVWRWQGSGVRDKSGTKTGPDTLIGRKALVIETLDPVSEAGLVRLAGTDWRGVLQGSETPVLPGSYVRVMGVEGNRLLVERM
jgi:membrane protein implicated in regulation of membrane protease activity